MTLLRTISVLILLCGCGRANPGIREQAAPFAVKQLAYCQIPAETRLNYLTLMDDYIWLTQTAEDQASVTAVQRGEGVAKATRFVIEKLSLSEENGVYVAAMTEESYGTSPKAGAMYLGGVDALLTVDLGLGVGSLTKIQSYAFSGRLDCQEFVGEMPY